MPIVIHHLPSDDGTWAERLGDSTNRWERIQPEHDAARQLDDHPCRHLLEWHGVETASRPFLDHTDVPLDEPNMFVP